MAFTKTRIWRGGVAGTPPAHNFEPEPEHEFSDGEQAHLERAAERAVLPGFQARPPSPLATTRFMPIEQLFPGQQQEPVKPEFALTPVRSPGWGKRASAWLAQRGATGFEARPRLARIRVAIAVVLLLLSALALLPTVRGRFAPTVRSLQVAEPRQPAPGAEPPPSSTAQTRLKAEVRVVSAKPAGLEREAIDALVSGDLSRAEALYQRLSEGAPGEAVYGAALRILRTQNQSRSAP